MALAPGKPVPQELSVLSAAGEQLPLASVLQGTDTLAIFLRHLG